MSKIILLLKYEEGTKLSPYIDSLGYPTIGTGFRIGLQNSPLENYIFTITQDVNDVWLQSFAAKTQQQMEKNVMVSTALKQCNSDRVDILTSMAYQMGVSGLDGFKNMFVAINRNDWQMAAAEMLNSQWAKQTPDRAKRHASVMLTGTMLGVYSF